MAMDPFQHIADRKALRQLSCYRDGDASSLFGNHDREAVGLFSNADRGAMPRSKLLGERRIGGERQKTRGGGDAFSDTARGSSICGAGVFGGFGVSLFSAEFDFSLFVVLSDAFFAPVFFFAGFGVGVWRCFVFGVGDFFGFGVDASRVSVSSD